MRLVFYGGGDDVDNFEIDSSLMKLLGKSKGKVTYIPSCSYGGEADYREFVSQYLKFNIHKFIYFPIDIPFDEILKEEAFSSDIIHLSGGNTFYFLKHIRQNKLFSELRQFVERGGILTGLSAGAILMTPNVHTAGMPDFDCDFNDDNLTNFRALNLVDFEIFPHYKNSKRYDRELLNYSKERSRPLYACPNGTGIIVDGQTTSFIGKVFCFYQGKKMLVA